MEIYKALFSSNNNHHHNMNNYNIHTTSSNSNTLLFHNYLKPDSNAPSKRGRGRPPKPKASELAGVIVAPPRPRGRPSKLRDLFPPPAPSKKKSSGGNGRPRGRPQKKAKIAPPVAATSAPATAASTGPLKNLFTSQIQ